MHLDDAMQEQQRQLNERFEQVSTDLRQQVGQPNSHLEKEKHIRDTRYDSMISILTMLIAQKDPQSIVYANHQAELFKLKQTTYVVKYQARFEKLGNQVVGLSHEAILNCFIFGLVLDIQNELAIHKPVSIS